jgi:ubiquinol-cytochrome c reductase iron-sulfur subunit
MAAIQADAGTSSKYTNQSESTGRNVNYFMIGTMGLLTAAGAKSTVSDFIANLTASADVLALAKVEVDLTSIPEGKVGLRFSF